MTQHNNNLSLHQQGEDVALLQSRLMTMGHTIATSEILSELFGESTQQAVIQFQQAEGLPVTGRVNDATAQAIVSSFEADKTVIKHTPLPIYPEATLAPPAIPEDVLGKPVEIVSDQQVAAGSNLFLSCGIQSEDRKDLHNELQALGYAISVEERQEALFGATALGAAQVFQ